ncbi:MAG TPA: pyridoxamine 5'-phosphate oxidase family protein [Woeseiaceae bacterium]|nr:pyridoxamine 5'-phosphate oxidase family protein [Woeseiaceae bacterium]
MHEFAHFMFTDAVRRAQRAYGSHEQLARFTKMAGPNDRLTDREIDYIARRDSFYMATVNEDGWPYVQHRGGPRGFLRVTGPGGLAFADYRGNRQLISVGNSTANNKVSVILMDYPNRRRLKIIGHLRFVHAADLEPGDLAAFHDADYGAQVERVAIIDVAAFDWNCPQHITPRYTAFEWDALRAPDR